VLHITINSVCVEITSSEFFENFRIRNVSAREILEKGFDVVEFRRGTSRFVILSQCPWYRGVSCRVSDTKQSSIGEQMRRKDGESYT